MESNIFLAEGVVLQFTDRYRIPTQQEWVDAGIELGEYDPPDPPDEYKHRVETELMAEAGRFAVIHGSVATTKELYVVVAKLQVWSSKLSEPQYVITPETSELG